MTELEITERLILAAEIEGAAAFVNVGPGRGPGYVQAMALPYVHDWADKNGWGKERLKQDEREFQESVSRRPTPAQISEAEEAVGWYTLVENDDHRVALAAWVACMVDNKRQFFKDWCRDARISEKTGRKRKDAAIARIHAQLVRSDVQNCNILADEGLLDDPGIGDVDGRIGDAWRGDPYSLKQASGALDFSWAQKRNERRRRQHEAKRKREAA